MDIEMPMTLTRRAIAEAMGCNLETVSRRLKGLPITLLPSPGRGAPRHLYHLPDVLSRVKKPQHIGPLFRAGTDDSSLHVGTGPEVMQRCERIANWLTMPMRQRYAAVRNSMIVSIANARGGEVYLPFIETINQKVLLNSDILKHVVMGTTCAVSFRFFGPAFALINATFEPGELEVAA